MRRTAPALALVGCLALGACAGGGSAGDEQPAGPPQPGGTLVVAVSSDAGCADPQQVASNDAIFSMRQIVDSLTDQDPGTGEIRPWLAESWSSNPEATAWTFRLRPGATFSDGTPVDANAVKANFDRIPTIGARGVLPKSYLAGYQGTDVVSPQELTVRFDTPNVQFLQGTSTHSLGLLSPASAALPDDERCAGVVGSGPFVVESYVRDDATTLVRRAGYAWGSSLFTHPGEAYLERAEFRVVPESGVRTGSVQSGEVDVIASIGPQDEAPLEAAGIDLASRANPGTPFGIRFNLATPIGADPAVREAVSAAIDRQELVATVYTSQTRPATSSLSSTTPDHTDGSAALAVDPARAAAVLDAAGWVPGPDGIRARAGAPLTIPLLYAPVIGTNRPALELIQQQLRAVGIDLQLQERPVGDTAAIQQSGQFTAFWSNTSRADPDILRTQYSSQGANPFRFPSGTRLDDLLAAQAGTLDDAVRTQQVADVQAELLAGHLDIPVAELTTTLGVGPQAHDLGFDASSRIQLHGTWKSP